MCLKQGKYFKAITKKKLQIYRNIDNIVRYGPSAPRYAERVWVDPQKCTMFLSGADIKKYFGVSNRWDISGKVVKSSHLFNQAIPIDKIKKFKFCIEHFVNGVPWKDTGAYEYQLQRDEYIEDIVERYENLDLVFKQAKKDGRLRIVEEINYNVFLKGSTSCGLVHIGPYGQLFFGGGGGNHRFVIAYILKIPYPAQIGCVHVDAIPYLDVLRQKNPGKLKKI